MKNLSEDHKEIQSGKKLDDEGYMAKVEMDKIEQSLEKLRKVIKKSGTQLPSWVQSKITKSSDYLDIVADYLASDVKMDENTSFTINKEKHKEEGTKHRRTSKVEKASTSSQQQLPNVNKLGPRLPKFEETSLVDKILSELEEKKYMTKDEDPCWKGYEMVGFKKKKGKKVPNCVPVSEATTRLPMKTGQLLRVLVNWRGKHLSVQMFFPQLGTPKRNEITYAVNQIYPEARVISYVPCEMDSSTPIVQVKEEKGDGNSTKKPLNKITRTPGERKKFKVYVKNKKTGNTEIVRFGDPNMEIKRDDPDRLAAFRSRHNCDNATDKTTPKYWSCKQWRPGKKVED
jgi:hypothetical protein